MLCIASAAVGSSTYRQVSRGASSVHWGYLVSFCNPLSPCPRQKRAPVSHCERSGVAEQDRLPIFVGGKPATGVRIAPSRQVVDIACWTGMTSQSRILATAATGSILMTRDEHANPG